MTEIREFAHQFRRPKYPVLIDLQGHLIAAKSAKSLAVKLARLRLPDGDNYPAVDSTGEGWALYVFPDGEILTPIAFKKRWTKREVIQTYNQRQNKSQDDTPYSEKSLSSKRFDRIVLEIAELLLRAE